MTYLLIAAACALALALLALPGRRRQPRHRGLPCVVTTEWCGGARVNLSYCHTHDQWFAVGSPCPGTQPI